MFTCVVAESHRYLIIFFSYTNKAEQSTWEMCFNRDTNVTFCLFFFFSVFSMGRRRCVRTAWTLTSRTSTSLSWTPAILTASTASVSCSGATISPGTHRRPPSTTLQQMSSSRWGYQRPHIKAPDTLLPLHSYTRILTTRVIPSPNVWVILIPSTCNRSVPLYVSSFCHMVNTDSNLFSTLKGRMNLENIKYAISTWFAPNHKDLWGTKVSFHLVILWFQDTWILQTCNKLGSRGVSW